MFFIHLTHMETLKEILLLVPQGLATGLVMIGSLMALAYFLVWRLWGKRLAHLRIQPRPRADRAQIRRELLNALPNALVSALVSSIVIYCGQLGYTQVYTDFSQHSPWLGLGGFVLLLVIDDTWFYWMHRLLHHPRIYRFIHLEHHKSIDVTPFTSMSFHFLEPLLLTLWIFPVAFYLPVYAPVLAVVQVWGALDNIKSHLGYELYPAWWNRSPLGFLTSSTYHNLHHSRFKGNYGVHFRIWDRLMGTEMKEYEGTYAAIKTRKREEQHA